MGKNKVERNSFTLLAQPLKILCTGCRKKPKRHFRIALNLISAIRLASKNTYHGRIWGLHVSPKLEPQSYKGFRQRDPGSGSCQVSRATITDRRFLEMRVQWLRSKHFSACSLGTCGNYPNKLNSGCWEVSRKASVLKNDRSWTRMNLDFSSEYANEIKAFNMKRPSFAFGNSNYQVAGSQGNFKCFILQEDMWIVLREVRRGFLPTN